MLLRDIPRHNHARLPLERSHLFQTLTKIAHRLEATDTWFFFNLDLRVEAVGELVVKSRDGLIDAKVDLIWHGFRVFPLVVCRSSIVAATESMTEGGMRFALCAEGIDFKGVCLNS